ncbi:MAG: carbohydrate binding family 9 domain-containing protein, partial [Methanomassiliicoccales archaeon]
MDHKSSCLYFLLLAVFGKITYNVAHRTLCNRSIAFTCILLLIPTLQLRSFQNLPADLDEPRIITANRLAENESVRLDGRLNEPIWHRSIPATDFLQQEPKEGEAATEQTEVYVLYDSDDFYIGAILYDSDVDGILAYQKQRDASLGTDDRFMLILDTFLDGRTGYYFEINPAGLMSDDLLTTGSVFGVNKSWDGIWETHTTIRQDGWSAEIRIPFRTLNFDPERDTWGINFQRTVRRKNEETLWSGYRRNQGIYRPVHAGKLTGLRGISQGIGFEAKPYTLAGWRNMPNQELQTSLPTDMGVDLSYSITPNLRAALTINTDFAEVEVDQRRVNLTRFPLYFPEKRDFFLEGSSVFSFVPRNGVIPYFSRRIGLVKGEQIPITYGARLGGQAGRYELGFIQVHTGRHKDTPTEDFTIARVKRTLFRQSSIGAIYTRRATEMIDDNEAPPDRYLFGVDLDLFTSRFLGDRNLQFEAFVVCHTDPVASGNLSFWDLSTRGVRLNYPNDIWRGHVSFREFGDEFDPATGFQRRNGFRRFQPTIAFTHRPMSISSIRQFDSELEFIYLTDLSSHLLTRETNLTLLETRFESGDNLTLEISQIFEHLEREFKIHQDIIIPIGNYNTLEWKLIGRTASYRSVSGNVELSRGEFWSGNRSQYGFGFTVKPYPGLSFTTEAEKNDVSLVEGNFSTHLFRLIGSWHSSPWTSVIGNLQYDDVSKILGLFARFRFIIRPGSDLFIVYTH